MYYITGGRRQKTRLFRVTYTGKASTEPVVHQEPQGLEAALRKTRQELESFHGEEDPKALEVAWPKLSHEDRRVRFAARTAIEHQPVDEWAHKAASESDPLAAIELAVAVARAGSARHRDSLLERLNRLDFKSLALEQQLDLLRAYGLIFIRLGGADAATTKHLVATLNPLYPAGVVSLDHELCQMLLYLNAPGAASRSVGQLLAAEKQSNEMFYAYHLRTMTKEMSVSDLELYFGWMDRGEATQSDYVGGGHFRNFLKLVRRDGTSHLSPEQKTAIASILENKSEAVARPKLERDFVRKWTLDELTPALSRVEKGRSFLRGKKISEALCSGCHLFKGQGGAIGPDLTSVGGKYKYDALLVEVMEPSRVISEQHASHVLVLKDGTTLVGREIGGDDKTIRMAVNPKNPDEVREVARADVLTRTQSKTSMMPTNLLDVLNEEEILDLLMYLASGGRSKHTAFDR